LATIASHHIASHRITSHHMQVEISAVPVSLGRFSAAVRVLPPRSTVCFHASTDPTLARRHRGWQCSCWEYTPTYIPVLAYAWNESQIKDSPCLFAQANVARHSCHKADTANATIAIGSSIVNSATQRHSAFPPPPTFSVRATGVRLVDKVRSCLDCYIIIDGQDE
jgi:hypothetical protein